MKFVYHHSGEEFNLGKWFRYTNCEIPLKHLAKLYKIQIGETYDLPIVFANNIAQYVLIRRVR